MVIRNSNEKKGNSKNSKKFHRPKTEKKDIKQRYQKKLDYFTGQKNDVKIFKFPVTTESSMRKIQSSNTIVLIFDPMANKRKIRFLMEKIYKTKVVRVNTLITPQGHKKAFIKLSQDQDALDVANKIGFI